MGKILIGAGTAAVWLALSYAAHADSVCRQVCDHGNCVSKCVHHSDRDMMVRDHDRYRHDHPGVGVHAPGVDIDVGR